jgi:hypothetical protein
MGSDGILNYRDNLIAAPYRVLSNGTATTPTTIVTSAIVPINVTETVRLNMNNNGTPVASLAPRQFQRNHDRVRTRRENVLWHDVG